MTTYPAPKPVRRVISKPLRNSARDKFCTLRLPGCEPGNETVVLAHLRGVWSLGTGIKPHDFAAIYCCQSCHDRLDGRRAPKPPLIDVLRALIETQSLMLDAGLITVKGDQ